jgi:hypothetical protein
MAITINGSGTITGISAGGLPDGSVTAADLASGAITSGALPTGSVLQVVQGEVTSQSSTTSTSYVSTPLTASITPTSSSNKILVIFSGITTSAGTGGYWGAIALFRDGSTNIIAGQAGVSTGTNAHVQSSLVYLDSPNTTSSTSYTFYFKSEGNSSTVFLNKGTGVVVGEKATITLMEIAG